MTPSSSFFAQSLKRYQSLSRALDKWLSPLALLSARLLVAKVFLASGLSKWNGFLDFNTDKYDLFLYEFFCPDPIRPGALLLCDPTTLDYPEGSWIISAIEGLAVTAGVLEVVLPILLIIGFISRPAALGLLAMTLFIQLAVFPTWSHWWNPAAWWALCLLVIIAKGPGKLSLDALFKVERSQ